MAIDAADSTLAAQQLAKKRQELEDMQNSLEVEKARLARQKGRDLEAAKEQSDKELVEISKMGAAQVEQSRKMNSERIRQMNENQQKDYEKLAATTAEEVKRLKADSLKAIEDHRASTTERVRYVTDQTEDPFYRLKTLNPVLTETDTEFRVKLSLPEHEARNVFVAGEGQSLKISLARQFQEKARNEVGDRSTKTASYQSIVETLALPGAVDAKGIKRDYADGVLTLIVPRAGLKPPSV